MMEIKNNNEQDNLQNSLKFKMEVTEDEMLAIQELADRVEDLNEEMSHPETLLRFIRARDCDVNKAEQMLRKSAKWREENHVNSYRLGASDYILPKVLADDYIIQVLGTNSQGYPVIYVPLGRWNIRDRINDGYLEETLKARFYLLEGIIMEAVERSTRSQFILLLDLAQLSFYKCAHVDTMNVVIKLFQDFDCHYPERLNSGFIVNTPWVFNYVFSIVKPWVAPKTLSKINIYDGNKGKWLPMLKNHVPLEILPAEFSVA